MCMRFTSVVLVLMLASITFGIQLSDFEDPLDPNHGGWIVYDDPCDPNGAYVSLSYSSTTGVTSGSYSLNIVAQPGWQRAIEFDLLGSGLAEELRTNLKISADVTRLTSDWTETGGSYCDFALAIQAGSSGDPDEPNDPDEWDVWSQPSEGGNWLPVDGDDPMTVVYDYSMALNEMDFDNIEYLNLIFHTNYGGFDPGGVYYLDNVRIFGGGPAYDPSPGDGQREVRRDVALSWESGVYSDQQDVYFGTSFDDVNDADTSDTTGVYRGRQDANTYDPPGFLDSSTTYYWRIDGVNEAGPDPGFWKGEVWSFTTPYPGTAVMLGDWEQTLDGWGAGFQGTTTFDYSDEIGVTLGEWSLAVYTSGGYWTFRREGLVDLTNMTFLLDVTMIADEWQEGGNWTKLDKMAIGSDLTPDWREFNSAAIDRNTGEEAPADWGPWAGDAYKIYSWDLSGPSTTGVVYDDWAEATWITINIALQNTGDPIGAFYFDNARLVDARVASDPDPTNYAEEVWIEPTLTWKPGTQAATHDVYFGKSFDDLSVVDRSNLASYPDVTYANVDVTSYEPPTLELDTIYYWRVDEANGTDIWKGPVWTFLTGKYLVVDNFEDYNDTPPYTVWNAWIDGILDPENGSQVGYDVPGPYTEQTIVHGGDQSMPLLYNNTTAPALISEATRTLTSVRDWTTEGVKALGIWFRGHPEYLGSFVEGPAGTYTMVASGADIWDPSDEFHFAYKTLTGVGSIKAKVESVQNTNGWAKAGVMIRETLEPGSKHAFACITPSQGVASQGRLATAGESYNTNQTGVAAPHWVKVEIAINGDITVLHSADGSTWDPVEGADTPTIQMASPRYIGLALTSHVTDVPCQAVFSDVEFTGNVTGDWTDLDIGILSNDAEQMYVAVANDTGTPAVVYYGDGAPDPAASQINTWTEWNIDLQEFADQGITLTDVNSITLGLGDRDNPQAGGEGTMYFDDIRLYRPRCVPEKVALSAADLNDDCVVDYEDLEMMADDWLASGAALAADVNADTAVDLRDYAVLAEAWLDERLWP